MHKQRLKEQQDAIVEAPEKMAKIIFHNKSKQRMKMEDSKCFGR